MVIKRLFKKIWHIIISNLYYRPFKKHEWLFVQRKKICDGCPNKKNIPVLGEICDLCGCPLESKLRVKDEKCLINKW